MLIEIKRNTYVDPDKVVGVFTTAEGDVCVSFGQSHLLVNPTGESSEMMVYQIAKKINEAKGNKK